MTEALVGKTCTPCRGGIPPLTRDEAALIHAQAPDWQLLEEAHRIERSFRFRNFREALTFVQEIGELAEAEGHHPNISFGWGNATISLQTKKIKGLHENDFIMATMTAYLRAWPLHERVVVVLQLAPVNIFRKIGRPIEGGLNTLATCKSADVRDPFLGLRLGCGSGLCRKLEHRCFLTFNRVGQGHDLAV